MRCSARGGFTRLELGVVIVMLVLIAGLLLPLLGRTYIYSHRDICINNQSQIGCAYILYATTMNHLPTAMSSPPTAEGPAAFGWVQGLLSHLARSDLAPLAPTMTAANAPQIQIILCPSDPDKMRARGGTLSYVVNSGSFKHWHPDGSFDCLDRGEWDEQIGNSAPTRTWESLAKIKGTSLIISLSENIDARSYVPTSIKADYEMSVLWDPSAPLGFNQDAGSGKLDNEHARPSSKHPGGAVVNFCDGHTAFISDAIDYKLYATLMTSDMTCISDFFVSPFDPGMIPTK